MGRAPSHSPFNSTQSHCWQSNYCPASTSGHPAADQCGQKWPWGKPNIFKRLCCLSSTSGCPSADWHGPTWWQGGPTLQWLHRFSGASADRGGPKCRRDGPSPSGHLHCVITVSGCPSAAQGPIVNGSTTERLLPFEGDTDVSGPPSASS